MERITLKTTVREIVKNPYYLSAMNEASGGLFRNPGILQADSMPLERIAAFLPQNGLSLVERFIEKANALLEQMDIREEETGAAAEIAASRGLEASEPDSEKEKRRGVRSSFTPGRPWYDTEGNRIQAHGGTMFTENGRYYWIGENKDHTTAEGEIWTWGVKIYSSDDLYNWRDEGYLVEPELQDPASLFYPTRRLDRPHLIYNRLTESYVLWLKFIDKAHFSVLTAKSLLGPYTLVREELHPLGADCGDFDLAVDEATGQGYLFFEANHRDLWGLCLTEDYTDVCGEIHKIYENIPLPYTREGIAHIAVGGKHYLFTSGMTGYIPNPSEVCVSDDWLEGYRVLGDPHGSDSESSSYNSQFSCIFKLIGQDAYVAMADRWVPSIHVDEKLYGLMTRVIESRTNPEVQASDEERAIFSKLPMLGSADTSVADYVWLPVSFGGEVPQILWQDEWRINKQGVTMENRIDFPHFHKQHDYVLCIDSDGTVMDAMNVKHKKCFGPCFVEVFGLEDRREEVLEAWNGVNLHGETRARNRFITVRIMLRKYQEVIGCDLSALDRWEETTDMLTNGSIEKEIAATDDALLKQVYRWSLRCNEEISKLTFEDKKPFEGVREFFEAAAGKVDLAVVSSSNLKALMEEWNHFGLYDYMTLLTSQEDGTKIECIDKILGYGYQKDHVIMMGDAIVDLETAEGCGVFFYPVVPEKEPESWRELKDRYLDLFISGQYETVQDELIELFKKA